ncbi:metal-sulfur cluster assembly factor [Candidatus Micrarchaeota archaeon]|nr:metal-sulfur cluster assembly factor [Candidatus Micrarchaeota archaeon]
MITEEQVKNALKEVFDPEIGINVVDLGLIYDIKIDGPNIHLTMTMTTPACPVIPMILDNARMAIGKVEGVKSAEIDLVWDPPWTPERMSEDAKAQLGMV